jgi:hypothetical protein
MFIFRTSRSDSGRSRSIDKGRSSLRRDHPHAVGQHDNAGTARLCRGEEFALGVVVLTAAHDKLVFLRGDIEIVSADPAQRAQCAPFGLAVRAAEALDVVGG